MGSSGKFDKVVVLERPLSSEPDGLGHETKTFEGAYRCNARIWLRSEAEQSQNPAEFPVRSLRLLLRLPPKEFKVGWGLTYENVSYYVTDSEERDHDLLVTCQPR